MDGADLHSAHLEEADVSNAFMTGAFVGYANLLETNLRDADLRDAIGLTAQQLRSNAFAALARLPAKLARELDGAISGHPPDPTADKPS